MQEPVANPWPESPQPPPVQEANCLVSLANPKFEAARQVARLLARHDEQGFQHIKFDGQPVTETAQHGRLKFRALLRLALIGDQDLLSKEALKRASHWRRQAESAISQSIIPRYARSKRCRERSL